MHPSVDLSEAAVAGLRFRRLSAARARAVQVHAKVHGQRDAHQLYAQVAHAQKYPM